MTKKLWGVLFFICFALFQNDVAAKPKCTVTTFEKTCVEKANKNKIIVKYTYKDKSKKILKKRRTENINVLSKVTYRKTRTFYDNGTTAMMLHQYYNRYFKDNKSTYYSNGKIRFNQTREWFANSSEVKISNYNDKGIFINSSYHLKHKNGSLLSSTEIKGHSNGKYAYSRQKNYQNKKVVYDLIKKYNTKQKLYYFHFRNTKNNLVIGSKTFDKNGRVLSATNDSYNKKNVLVNTTTTSYYTNGRKSRVVVRLFNNKKYKSIETFNYKNNVKTNLISKDILYYNNIGKHYKRVNTYYNQSNFRYIGYRDVFYNANTGKLVSAKKYIYYLNTNKLYYLTDSQYSNGKLSQSTTNYYNTNKVRYQNNITKYNSNNKVTSNLNSFYRNGVIYERKGYTYQTTNYTYCHNEYVNGKLFLSDNTTYRNNSTNKEKYQRATYRNGNLIEQEIFSYNNGEVVRKQSSGNKLNSNSIVKPTYPVTKGLVTSQAWFYPKSFGGGWHPGLDIGTYSIKNYGYAQPIKVVENATLLKRVNNCKTTSRWGCGEGFGNYSLYAFEKDGKFYTVLYGHQSQLNTKNKNHKVVLDNDKKPILKNNVIGFVGNSGNSSGYHVHIQFQEHRYAKKISDIQVRYKKYNNSIFNVNYNNLSNYSDIYTVNPDVFYNLKYAKSW